MSPTAQIVTCSSKKMRRRDWRLRLRAFRAVDEPHTCSDYVRGHHQVLESHGIECVSSSEKSWTTNEGAYVIIVEDLDQDSLVAGIRLHLANPFFSLPTEEAVGRFDSRLGRKIREGKPAETGEICGMWKSQRVTGFRGLASELAVAAITISNAIGLRHIWGLAPTHTLRFWQRFGYRVVTSVGKHGAFQYPDSRYVSRVVALDGTRLNEFPIELQRRIAELRQFPTRSSSIALDTVNIHLDYDVTPFLSHKQLTRNH